MSPTDKILWIPKPWGQRLNSLSVEVELAAWEGCRQRLILDFSTALEKAWNQWVSFLQILNKRYFQSRIRFPVRTSVMHEVDRRLDQRQGFSVTAPFKHPFPESSRQGQHSTRGCTNEKEALTLETGEPRTRQRRNPQREGPEVDSCLAGIGSPQSKNKLQKTAAKRVNEWNSATKRSPEQEGLKGYWQTKANKPILKFLISLKAKFVRK